MARFGTEQPLVRILSAAIAFRAVLEQPATSALAAALGTTATRIHRITVQLGAGKRITRNVSHARKSLFRPTLHGKLVLPMQGPGSIFFHRQRRFHGQYPGMYIFRRLYSAIPLVLFARVLRGHGQHSADGHAARRDNLARGVQVQRATQRSGTKQVNRILPDESNSLPVAILLNIAFRHVDVLPWVCVHPTWLYAGHLSSPLSTGGPLQY